jgi:hypothetical protein
MSASPPPLQAVSTPKVPFAEAKFMTAIGFSAAFVEVTARTPLVDHAPEMMDHVDDPVVEEPRPDEVRLKVSVTADAEVRVDTAPLDAPAPTELLADILK